MSAAVQPSAPQPAAPATSADLEVVGVRHHSPACARLVARTIERLRPRFVLIEGPADMNDRIEELLLEHELPIAIYTHYRDEKRTHASWTPFCIYSPEWVALREARRVGATPLFMDLPAWHEAFAGERNRYADRRRRGPRLAKVLASLGVEEADAGWDHLFERPMDVGELRERLRKYFDVLRADEPADTRDQPREAYMVRAISWALGEVRRQPRADPAKGGVVVVCGGFHAPWVERHALATTPEASFPEIPAPSSVAPEDSAVPVSGSFLVPYTYRRLDSFVGYESGMPSPLYYEELYERGPEEAFERMLTAVVRRLREKKQPASTAELIVCTTTARSLARLRGREQPLRVDLLDAIANVFIKEGLEIPLPWQDRRRLRAGTDPLLVEVVDVLSGTRRGKLAPETPRPPLVVDVLATLEALDLSTKRDVRLDLTNDGDRGTSHVLHRLAILRVPGFERVQGPSTAIDSALTEHWRAGWSDEALVAVLEASSYGPTLPAAAASRIEESIAAEEGNAARLASALDAAILAGLDALADRVAADVRRIVESEPQFPRIGGALQLLFDIHRFAPIQGSALAGVVAGAVEAAFDRALWLLEGLAGPEEPARPDVVEGMRAITDVARRGPPKLAVSVDRALGVAHRRSLDADAPPAVRGGALGLVWVLAEAGLSGVASDVRTSEAEALRAVRGVSRPASLGDLLAGLFAVAREVIIGSQALLTAVDDVLRAMVRDDFLGALPSLKLAFSFFPPRERERIAEIIVRLHPNAGVTARDVVRSNIDVPALDRAARIEEVVQASIARYGLQPDEPETEAAS